jgi:DNA polymerase-3 subunit delta
VQLRAEQLASHLKGTLAPLYVLHGDEPLLVIEAGDAIRARRARAASPSAKCWWPDAGFKWSALAEAAGNLSLFGGDKLIDLRIPTGKPGRDGGEVLRAMQPIRRRRHDHADHPAADGLEGPEERLVRRTRRQPAR